MNDCALALVHHSQHLGRDAVLALQVRDGLGRQRLARGVRFRAELRLEQ